MSIASTGYNVSCKSNISLLIFCLDDLSRTVDEILSFPIMIVFQSVSPFSSVSNCFIYFGAP